MTTREHPTGTRADGARLSASVVPAAFAPQRLPSWLLRTLAVLGVVATLLGRGVAPALPGTASGIEGLIDLSRSLAAVASVNLFFLAGMVTVWLAIASLAQPGLPASYRLGVLPATATVIVLGIAALIAPIEARWLLWMGVISGSVALVAVPGTLAHRESRAVGFVLLLVGIAAFLQVIARMLAVRASDEALAALFGYARVFATLGFALHVAVLALVGLWLSARRWALLGGVGTSAVAFSLFVAWAAAGGTRVDAVAVQVLAARAFDELTRHPIPYAPALVRHAVDVLTLVTVALTVGAWRRPALLAAATGLALLGSGNADIPLCAVMLTLGALLGPLGRLTMADADADAALDSNRRKSAQTESETATSTAPDSTLEASPARTAEPADSEGMEPQREGSMAAATAGSPEGDGV